MLVAYGLGPGFVVLSGCVVPWVLCLGLLVYFVCNYEPNTSKSQPPKNGWNYEM